MHFTEPITILNSTNFLISTDRNSNVNFRFRSHPVVYKLLNMEAVFEVLPICTEEGFVVQADGNSTMECISTMDFKDYYIYLLTFYNSPLYLSFDGSAAEDFASSPNAISPVQQSGISNGFEIGAVDCSLCPTGEYVSQRCTPISDRICTPCSTNEDGYYTKVDCSNYEDALFQSKSWLRVMYSGRVYM